MPAFPLLPTSLVGSYPQPEWLIDRAKLAGRFPPRVRAKELWRVEPDLLAEAQDDATVVAVRAQERAGLDILTDGEIRRESYSNRFATALEGLDLEHPGTLAGGTRPTLVPRVVGPIRRRGPVEVRDLEFLRAWTDHPVKITLPGPFTMAQQAQDEYYHDPHALALAYAEAVNQEVRDLFAAGADVVQLDEPWFRNAPDQARAYGVEVVNRALERMHGTTALHLCFGYAALVAKTSGTLNRYAFLEELADCTVEQVSVEAAQPKLDLSQLLPLVEAGKRIMLGVLDLGDPRVETAEQVAERLRAALAYVPAEQLMAAPDCGMKYLPREVAFGKLRAMVEGARLVRERG